MASLEIQEIIEFRLDITPVLVLSFMPGHSGSQSSGDPAAIKNQIKKYFFKATNLSAE